MDWDWCGLLKLIKKYGNQKKLVILKPSWQMVDIGFDYLEKELKQLKWQLIVYTVDNHHWQNAVKQLHSQEADLLVLNSFFAEDMCDFY